MPGSKMNCLSRTRFVVREQERGTMVATNDNSMLLMTILSFIRNVRSRVLFYMRIGDGSRWVLVSFVSNV